MAIDTTPSNYISGFSGTTTISIPSASLSPESNAYSDIRKFMHGVCFQVYNHYNELIAANKPQKMTVAKSLSVNPTTNIATENYTFSFTSDLSPTATTVSAE